MNDSTKIIEAILQADQLDQYDIIYSLQLSGFPVSKIVKACRCSKEFVYQVIRGERKSFTVATYIADKLNTTTRRLWGDAYDYKPRASTQRAKGAANVS